MASRKDGKPDIYVTWLAKFLAGEADCLYAPWFKSRHWYTSLDKGSSTLVKWKSDHDAAKFRVRAQLTDMGATDIKMENQAKFVLSGNGCRVVGKPDLSAVLPSGAGVIVDIKTGKRRDSDRWQVQLYMRLLPMIEKGGSYIGWIWYEQEGVFEVVEQMADTQADRVFETLRTLGLDLPPETMPSFETCRNCSISALDCPDRIQETSREVETDAF